MQSKARPGSTSRPSLQRRASSEPSPAKKSSNERAYRARLGARASLIPIHYNELLPHFSNAFNTYYRIFSQPVTSYGEGKNFVLFPRTSQTGWLWLPYRVIMAIITLYYRVIMPIINLFVKSERHRHSSPSSLLLKKRILQIFEKVPLARLEPTPFTASSLQVKSLIH